MKRAAFAQVKNAARVLGQNPVPNHPQGLRSRARLQPHATPQMTVRAPLCACITSNDMPLSSSCTSCHTRRSIQPSIQPSMQHSVQPSMQLSMQQSVQLHMCQQPVAAQHASTLFQTTVLHVAAVLHGCCVCPAVIEKNRPSPASTHQVIVVV